MAFEVKGLTPQITSLGVTLRLNGRLSQEGDLRITGELGRFVVRLPNTETSRGRLRATVAGLKGETVLLGDDSTEVAVPTDGLPAKATVTLLSVQVCSADRWCWAAPRPQGNQLTGLWGADEKDIWAVGKGGSILHWNGWYWSGAPSGTTNDLHGVWGSDADNAWAVGSGGMIL